MSILRSFFVQQGAGEARFTADVESFLGVVAGPGGALVMTMCRGEPQPGKPTLLGPTGLALPRPQGDEWTIYVRMDGQEPPAGAQFLGGLGGAMNGAPMGVFFFAKATTIAHVGRPHRPGDNPP